MYYVVGALLTACVIYWYLQSIDDAKCMRENRPPATTGKKVILLFFLSIICIFVFYLIGNSFNTTSNATGGASEIEPKVDAQYKIDMVKNIREDVKIGLPPFSAALPFPGDDV
jgi:hypothetical protein